MVASAEGKYLVTLVRVRPGRNGYLSAPMALRHVERTGNPAVAWKYLTKSAMLGRSYELHDDNVSCSASLGILGRSDSPGCRAIRQSRGSVDSRQPVSTAVPCLSLTMTTLHTKATAQSASHRVPTPIKVWRNPDMRCPLVGNSDEIWGKDKFPVPADCCVFPVAVRNATLGAERSMLTSGASAEKYMLAALDSTMHVALFRSSHLWIL